MPDCPARIACRTGSKQGAPGIVHHTALYHYYKAKNIDTCSNNIDNVICRSVVDSSAFFRLFYNFEIRYVNTYKQQSTIS